MNRVPPIVGLASHLGRGVQRIATDAVVGRVRSLPRTVGDLDAKALSQIMGRKVTSVSVIGGDAGTSSRARLALTGDGVPDSVFVKMPAETVATRLMGELGRLAATETRFYTELSPELKDLPTAYGSAFDPLTGRFVLVLEDLAVDDCEFPDTLHPLSKDQAASIVELLARLHAAFWARVPGWLYTASADSTSLLVGLLLKTSARRLAERTDIPVGAFGEAPGGRLEQETDEQRGAVGRRGVQPAGTRPQNAACRRASSSTIRRPGPCSTDARCRGTRSRRPRDPPARARSGRSVGRMPTRRPWACLSVPHNSV